MKRFLPILLIFTCVSCISCSSYTKVPINSEHSYWSSQDVWYSCSLNPDADKVDVFYLVSTNVISATDSNGAESLRALLTTEDTTYINMELEFVKDSIFGKEFNFISPYYHQYTFDCFTNHQQEFEHVRTAVGQEVCDAFDYYMEHINNGRRFILAGFSQGGDMVMQILRHMASSPFLSKRGDRGKSMVAAYVMGFKVTAADTTDYATIRPAKGETDTGVVISYNSVLDPNVTNSNLGESICDFVAGGSVACINPINWKTDATPAEFTYGGTPIKVHIDKQYNILVVDTDPKPYQKFMRETVPFSTSGMSENCLHHWDILFYDKQIHDNALTRSHGKH